VATERERQELLAVLAGQPFLDFGLTTVESLAAERLNAGTAPEYGEKERQKEPAPLEAYLQQRVGSGPLLARDWRELANRAVSLSGTIRGHGWELARLAERYRLTGTAEMSHGSALLLELMIRQHMEQIRHEVRESRQLLEPLLAQTVAGVGPQESAGELPSFASWAETMEFTGQHAEEAERFTKDLFARSSLSDSEVESSARALLDSWNWLEQLAGSAQTEHVTAPWYARFTVAPAQAPHAGPK
jgi:hypothetical protein